jgi:hypothetical protein
MVRTTSTARIALLGMLSLLWLGTLTAQARLITRSEGQVSDGRSGTGTLTDTRTLSGRFLSNPSTLSAIDSTGEPQPPASQVPAPTPLLLCGAGLIALALWQRHAASLARRLSSWEIGRGVSEHPVYPMPLW